MGKHSRMRTADVFRVAVFGSCVTRDNFNRTFNPDYKDLFECVALADHVSLVSLMSPPVEVDVKQLDGVEPRLLSKLEREFSRAFLSELVEAQPHYLIMDFWPDLIFGFADLSNGGVVTHNAWSTVQTTFFKERNGKQLRPSTDFRAFFARWKKAADDFFDFARGSIPDTRIVVHSARNVRQWVSNSGDICDFSPWATSVNKYWDEMDNYVLQHHAGRQVAVMTEDLKSFEGHPWGKFPVHYTYDYHRRFQSRLAEIALRDAVKLERYHIS